MGKTSWCGRSFGLLWLRKLAKGMSKAMERQNGIFGNLFMKNKGN